jgi:DNA replication protein DnaC
MESLNDIIERTLPEHPRRSSYPTGNMGMGARASVRQETAPAEGMAEQKPHWAQTPPVSAPAPLPLARHRQLQEQKARLGQRYANREPSTRAEQSVERARAEVQRERAYREASVPEANVASSRSGYAQKPHYTDAEMGQAPARRQDEYVEMAARRPVTRSLSPHEGYHEISRRRYRTDDYLPPPQADVLNELDADDEESGMRYGDWEGEDEPVVYQDATVEVLPATPMQSQVTPAMQHTRQLQRMTQPLHPRSAPNLNAGRERPTATVEVVQRSPHMTRQLAPREPVAPQITPIPPRSTAPVTPYPGSGSQGSQRGPCPLCKGAGFLRADVPFGHPQFGKPQPCQCKEAERREKRRQQLLELSDIRAFRDKSFDNFDWQVQGIHPSVREAFQAAYAFMKNPSGWLVLIGTNGCGKTHLAAAIANQCLANGEVVLFSVVPELLDHLRAAFAPSATDVYDQLFSKMREAAILILDDLGAHYTTPWATEKLFQLLNYRYNWRMPTVITCNPSGLQTIDARLRSRMSDSSLVQVINLERARDCRPYLMRREQ